MFFSRSCCELMRAVEKYLIHLGVTFTRKTYSWYNVAANLISRIISPVLRSEMRLVMPRCIKFKWNGAKVAHCVARGSEGGTSRQKMSSWRKGGGEGQRWTIKSSYYPYYRRRCERARARRLRAESLSYNVHPLCTRCRSYLQNDRIIDRMPIKIDKRSNNDRYRELIHGESFKEADI